MILDKGAYFTEAPVRINSITINTPQISSLLIEVGINLFPILFEDNYERVLFGLRILEINL